MQFHRNISRAVRLGFLALLLTTIGCASSPIPRSPHASLLQCQPAANLDNVHVIFVESPADLGHWGRFDDVCYSMQQLGLDNTVFFKPRVNGHSCDLAEYIRNVRRQNPNSRVMLVGWSMGSLYIRKTLKLLDQTGDRVDTVVYLDSVFLTYADSRGHPANADRVLLIYRSHKSPPQCIPNSEVQYINCQYHLPVAHCPATIDSLVQEALALSATAPPTDRLSSSPTSPTE